MNRIPNLPGKQRSSARRAAAAVLVGAALAVSVTPASADEYVSGYYRSNGTYVGGYHRTDADGLSGNNYSHYGNYNPYTQRYGTHRDLASIWGAPSYASSTYRPYSSHSYGGSPTRSSGRR